MTRIRLAALLTAVLLAAVLLVAATGCGPAKTPLYVYNWGEYIAEDVIALFEEENPDITVKYKTYSDNETMYPQISKSAFDVLFPSDYMVIRLIREGMLAKPDFANLPNAVAHTDPRLAQTRFDPDDQLNAQLFEYAVPYLYCTVGLIYNTDVIDLGGSTDPKDVWGVLFNPEYVDRIGMYDSMRESIGAALNYLGYSLNTMDPAELAEAKALLIRQRQEVRPITGIDELKDKYVSGELVAGIAWSGDYQVCLDKLSEENAPDTNLAYVLPKGSNFAIDFMCIPANAQHKAEAERFIDFMCRPDIALKNAEYVLYSSPNLEVVPQLPEELRNDPSFYPDGETLASLEVFFSNEEIEETYARIWEEVTGN